MPAGRENYSLLCSTFQLDGLYSVKYWSGIRNDLEESYLGLFSGTIPAFPRMGKEVIKNSTRFQENYDEFYYRPPDPKCSPRPSSCTRRECVM